MGVHGLKQLLETIPGTALRVDLVDLAHAAHTAAAAASASARARSGTQHRDPPYAKPFCGKAGPAVQLYQNPKPVQVLHAIDQNVQRARASRAVRSAQQ